MRMYSPATPNVDSIIHNTNIKLPRFQRKKTWEDKRRFELCISLFKGYPLGTIVLKEDTILGKDNIKMNVCWLLDGRQRRDTFEEMQDPLKIYQWAVEYLDINKNDKIPDIRANFKRKIYEYLQEDEDAEKSEGESPNTEPSPVIQKDPEDTAQDIPDSIVMSEGIQQLLDLICQVHSNVSGKDNFTNPFCFEGLKTYYMENGKVNSKRLYQWIKNRFILDENIDSLTTEDIFDKFDNAPESLKERIANSLPELKTSIKMVKTISGVLTSTEIQQITLTASCNMSDARKIFEIINTTGVALTGAEIMSAKPAWNAKLPISDEKMIKSIAELYKGLDIDIQFYVKWDVVASLVFRLNEVSDFILGSIRVPNPTMKKKSYKIKAKELEKKMTAGFKLMSAYHLKSITKDDIDKLPAYVKTGETTDLENEIVDVCKLLTSDDPFYRLDTYHLSMCDYLGFTVSINYLFLMINRWKELNKPTQKNSAKYRAFILDSRILFDKMVYEYVTNIWKGSSDSRLNRNLTSDHSIAFKAIPDSEWDTLIDTVYADNEINGQRPSTAALKALLVYFTMLRGKKMDASLTEPIQIDHIIPKSRFVGDYESDPFKDSLYNYAFLPRKLNLDKSGNPLKDLSNEKKRDIASLEDISEEIIDKMETPESKTLLIEAREHIIDEVKARRKEFVKTEGAWTIS